MTKQENRLKPKKLLSFFLKIIVSAGLLYLVYSKTDFSDIAKRLAGANMYYLLLGGIFLVLSQIASSFRLQYILYNSGFPLAYFSNLKLYLLGMFYNFFIPGGIGGDAYKVYVLNTNFKWKVKQLVTLVLVDRMFGMFAIVGIVCILGIVLPVYDMMPVIRIGLIIAFTVLFILILRWFVSFFFISYMNSFSKALSLSVAVQLLQVLCAVSILKSLDVPTSWYVVYSLIFLITSLLSIFSFSGIGVREYILFQASVLLSLDIQAAVTLGAVFSVLTAIISLPGIYYHFRKPILYLEEVSEGK